MSPPSTRRFKDRSTSLRSSRIGAVLCRCHGSLSSGVDLKEIGLSLAGTPWIAKVNVLDDLCNDPRSLTHFFREHSLDFILIGGCDEAEYISLLREQALREGLDPLAFWAVSIAGPNANPNSPATATRKAMARLLAALERVRHFSGSRPENFKASFVKPGKEMSRRDFLQFLRVRHQPIPVLDSELCHSHQGCAICTSLCPAGALTVERMKLSLDTDKCTGCGICLSLCPWEALNLPLFNTSEIETELRVLLSSEASQAKTITFTCDCSSGLWRHLVTQESRFADMLEFSLPCLGMVSPYLMVRAFTLGASGIIVAAAGSCPHKFNKEQLNQRVALVRHVLASWQEEPERLQVINMKQNGELASPVPLLSDFSKPMKQAFTTLDFGQAAWQNNHLGSLLKHIALNTPPTKTYSLTSSQVPFGMTSVESNLCTLCGLCTERCPAAAMTIEQKDRLELAFQYDKCVGCGSCEDICPEKCLRFTRTLEPDRLLLGKEILCRDDRILCRLCGSFITSQKTVYKVLQVTSTNNKGLSSYIYDLCPDCRPKAFLE